MALRTIAKVHAQYDDEIGPHWLAFTAMPGRDVTIENLRAATLPDIAPSGIDEFTYRVKNLDGIYSNIATCNVTIQSEVGPYVPPTMSISPTVPEISVTALSGTVVANITLTNGYGTGTFSLDAGSWNKLSIVPTSGNRSPQLKLNANAAAGDAGTKQAFIRYAGEPDQPSDLTATVNITVATEDVDPEPPSGDFFADDVPNPIPQPGGPANGIHEVTNITQLKNALAVVKYGEHIVLKANIISTNTADAINFTRTMSGGSTARPVVIRADTVLGRRIKLPRPNKRNGINNYPVGGVSFSLVQHFVIWGIEFEETVLCFYKSQNIKIYRNKFHGNHCSSICITGNGQNSGPYRFAFNDVSLAKYWADDTVTQSVIKHFNYPNNDDSAASRSSRDIMASARRAIEESWAGQYTFNVYKWRNYFHDLPPKYSNNYSEGEGTEFYSFSGAFSVGDNVVQALNPLGYVCHHNVFERCGGATRNHGTKYGFIKFKSMGSIFIQNSWKNNLGACDIRHGYGTVVAGDYFAGPMGGVETYNGDNNAGAPWNTRGYWNGAIWVGCKAINPGPAAIRAMGGKANTPSGPSAPDQGSVYPAAGTRYIGCDFNQKVKVGEDYGSSSYTKKTRDIRFYGCKLNGVLGTSLASVATLDTLAGGDEVFSQTIPSNWYVNTWADFWGVKSIPVSKSLANSEVGPNAPWRKCWVDMTQTEKNSVLGGTWSI